jgi:hypothetical protein
LNNLGKNAGLNVARGRRKVAEHRGETSESSS